MDTIVALATGPGGALAVIRLSGPDVIAIAGKIFRAADGVALADHESHTIAYGNVVDPAEDEVIDQVLVSLFRAPRSYTGDDSVEISCHGSPYIVRRIVELSIAAGARPAAPGEFTVRAFLAGKLDLSQAEAVADTIAATDRASHTLAMSQLRGGYSTQFAALREQLVQLASLLELELDFSEEEVAFADRAQLQQLIETIRACIGELSDSFRLGNALREGIPVAIVGAPNVGKSTLLNALLREDRAMTSPIAGTTRDVVEETLVVEGVRFRFLDTAGLRDTSDELERMGIERTRRSIERAQIVLWVVEGRDFPVTPPFELVGHQRLGIVINKIDRLTDDEARALLDRDEFLPVSAKAGINLEAVPRFLMSCVEVAPLYTGQTIVSHARHHEALLLAAVALDRAREALEEGLPADLLAEEIRQALYHLGTVTGSVTTDEILGNIFSKFCIGK